MHGGSAIHLILSSSYAPMIRVEPTGGPRATDNRGRQSFTGWRSWMPSEADTIQDLAAWESRSPTSNKSTFAFCSHNIKILKSDLDITHPDAMRAASDSPLPSKPFSAWSVWYLQIFSLELTNFFSGKHLTHFWCSRWRIFGISFYMTAFSFLTLNKFTLSFKSPISRIKKLK